LKQGSEIIGNRVRARIVKNKIAAPFKVAEFDIMFNEGISKMGDLLDLGVDQGLLKKSGAFYSYEDTKLGQGRENAKQFLKEHSEISEAIEAIIRSSNKPEDSTNGHTEDVPEDQLTLSPGIESLANN
jgi:recombination protein RecA